MTIPDWVPDAVFYQIFPERFCNGDPSNDPPITETWGGMPTRENFFGGDLSGITQKLDYIADLGCNALYLNPIFKAGTNHKYDTHDYFQIDPVFGDDAAFNSLVCEAHERGMKIVLDGVFNHCGYGFAPFQDVLENGANSSYKDWFDIYAFPIRREPSPNYATCGGAHYLPRLNTHHPGVEAFVHKVAFYWLARGIDGWRLDVPYEINTGFWRRFRKTVKESYPSAYLVAEEWRNPSAFLQGDTFDGATHYLLRGAAFDFLQTNALTGDAFLRALSTLQHQIPETHRQSMLTLLGSHDTARVLTLCQGDVDTAVLLYTFLLTMPGAPLIYYGDENGMVGESDPDCRRTMVWEPEAWNLKIRNLLKKLIDLRNNSKCLRRGALDVGFSNDRIACYYRGWENERVMVVLNNSKVFREIRIPVDFPDATVLTDALCGDTVTVRDGHIYFEALQPRRSWVFQQ